MTLADLCILVAGVLPVACAGIAKSKGFGVRRRDGGFDNHNPRQWLAGLAGWQARANAAQQNSFEALPLFIAGVLIAEHLHAPQARVDLVAGAFIVARLAYIGAYLADKPMIRSGIWAVGLALTVTLFFLG